jgi:hypothetical protein
MNWNTRVAAWSLAIISLLAVSPHASRALPRVALLDFTADDNSWPSSQSAANFTIALQAQLSSETEGVWVEREQLKLAETELRLSELGRMAGSDAIRRGKWVRADWLFLGRFTLDEDDERIARLELLDLNHAELLSEKTVSLSGDGSITASPAKLDAIKAAVEEMLHEGRRWLNRMTNQTVVAPLFFLDVTGWPQNMRGNLRPLERAFQEFAEDWRSTNQSARLIRFPKAYQSLDEAVMAVAGFTGEEPWKGIADLYVWGTCGITNRPNATEDARGNAVRVTVNSWDGIGEPVRNEELIRFRPGSELPVVEALATLDRMLAAAFQRARQGAEAQDTSVVRKRIASSLIRDFEAMSSSNDAHSLGLTYSDDERERFKGIVRMLEAACFFDPDNPVAHARRISTRWGWWTAFDTVNSEFWTAWRRGQEWGKYAERFGLASVITLPSPFDRSGIAGAYENSIADLERMMEVSNKEESYGFPAQVPEEVQARWQSEIQAEARARRQKVEALRKRENTAVLTGDKPGVSGTSTASNAPSAARLAQTNAIAPTTVTAGSSPTNWVKNWPAMFVVQKPSLLPPEFSPKLEMISFPRRAAVAAVNKLVVHGGSLWIVAEDEASEGANIPQPDISVEMSAEASRLWSCPVQNPRPRLAQQRGIPRYVTTLAVQFE